MAGLWRKPDRVEWKDGVPSYFWDLGTVAIPKPVTFLDVALSGPKVRPVIEPTPWIRSLGPALHVERTESYIDAETHAEEESRLLAQHAALRWERVARRWNYKHRGAGGLDERERRYVWMHWLDQTARRCP